MDPYTNLAARVIAIQNLAAMVPTLNHDVIKERISSTGSDFVAGLSDVRRQRILQG